MNKYTARALNEQAAIHGRRILVVSATWPHAKHAFDELRAAHLPTVTKITNSQRIEYVSGGRISVHSAQSEAHRGRDADIVFVDWDAELRYPGLAQSFRPCIQASPHGEVIRA